MAEAKRIAVGVFEPELAGVPGLIFGSRAGLFGQYINSVCPEIDDHRPGSVAPALAKVQLVASVITGRGISKAGSVWVVSPVVFEAHFRKQFKGRFDFAHWHNGHDGFDHVPSLKTDLPVLAQASR